MFDSPYFLLPVDFAFRLPLQEVKFKSYYHDLHWALTEYDRVVTEVCASGASLLEA